MAQTLKYQPSAVLDKRCSDGRFLFLMFGGNDRSGCLLRSKLRTFQIPKALQLTVVSEDGLRDYSKGEREKKNLVFLSTLCIVTNILYKTNRM